jgi:hypothetical protein
VNNYQEIRAYDSSGNITNYNSQSWDGAQWLHISQYTYYYTNENITNIIIQNWDGAQWMNYGNYTYTYNTNGNYINRISQNWDGTQWVNNNQLNLTYDANGNLTNEISQYWDGTQWENNSQYIYTWETLLSTNNKNILAEVFTLHQNYPNPFNPVTTLQYDLPEDALVSITIYDIMGRQISTLVSSQQNAGYKSIQWNATNNAGQPVSAGLYLYSIEAGQFRQTKKMVLLK